MKPICADICPGLLSKLNVLFVDTKISPLSIYAYYNPKPYSMEYAYIENSVVDNWDSNNCVLLGDFNKIFNINDYVPSSSESSSQVSKYQTEANNMKIWKGSLNAVCIRDRLSGFTRISKSCSKNIDHILFSRDLRDYVTPIRVKAAPFRTDHNITECELKLKITKTKRRFTISRNIFDDNKFVEECSVEIEKILAKEGDPIQLYYRAKKWFMKAAKKKQSCTRNKEIHEFKKIQEDLLKMKHNNQVDRFLLEVRMNSLLNKLSCDIEFSDMIFKTRRGPSAIITSLLKNKSRSITHFYNGENRLTGKQAANFAAHHQKAIYSNNIIVEEFKIKLLDSIERIDSNACSALEEDFTEEELVNASIYLKDSSPGTSGVPSQFLKKFRSPIKNLVTIGNKILDNGFAPEEMNTGLVCMLPKGDKDPSCIDNTRGITLLEIDRKLCTTAMTQRINKMFASFPIISPTQTCHIGRNMKENILILQFLFKQFLEKKSKEKEELYVLFLDFEKAFDRVDHDFLIEALRRMGFGPRFINFIGAFLKLNVKICFQGEFSDSYTTTCGVPQGEVFSPSLFVLIMDIFVKLLNKNNLIKGVKIDNSDLIIKSLHYADDSTHLFTSKNEYIAFKETLDLFSKGSNFKISSPKSDLIILNSEEKNFGEFNLSNNPVRYLGVYFDKKGLVNIFEKLFSRFVKDLTIIKTTFPNFLSKIDCFKSYVQGVLYFHGTFAEFDRKQIKKLEKLERWFLFSGDLTFNNSKKFSNINLTRLAQAKSFGGENLRRCWDLLCNSKLAFGLPCLLNKSKNGVLSQLFHNIAISKMRTPSWKSLFHPISFTKSDLSNISLKSSKHDFMNQIVSSCMHFKKSIKFQLSKERFRGYDFVSKRMFSTNLLRNHSIPVRYSKKKNSPLKCYDIDQWKNTKISYPFEVEDNTIKLKLLFEERRKAENIDQIFTKNQIKWIEDGIELEKLFRLNFFCLPNIKDFFRKTLHNYFRSKDKKCSLCNEKFDSIHLLQKCKIIKKWEIDAYGEEKRNSRIKHSFFLKNFTSKINGVTHSFLLNWAIWITRNFIVHTNDLEKKKNILENAHLYLIKNIKMIELNHCKFSVLKRFRFDSKYFDHYMFFKVSNGDALTITEI
eukprot:TRINITY_DN2035_c0_g1_i7.p1 TRINITY_DN2035_c0_g1~~TRINITY_DN2035_c0_g1_i7.p1  ORF type:complete len:1125 (+),score=171.41 TRINITY_DN2035_c0_g1_i7:1327-4701(+)